MRTILNIKQISTFTENYIPYLTTEHKLPSIANTIWTSGWYKNVSMLEDKRFINERDMSFKIQPFTFHNTKHWKWKSMESNDAKQRKYMKHESIWSMRNVGSLTTNMEEGGQRATNDRNQRILAIKYDTCENLTISQF